MFCKAGIGDVRIDLVQCLRERTERKEIFPSGIGLNMHLSELEIECNNCKKTIPFADVSVGPPTEHFGNLSYRCEHCCLWRLLLYAMGVGTTGDNSLS